MIARWQLPVSSPVAPRSLLRAARAAMRRDDGTLALAAAAAGDRFGPRELLLVDSGTSALVLALRMAVGAGGTVAFPGYACVDLAAAAQFAGVRVRLYDLDPRTLSPDLDSVARALSRGVDAIVVAHLFGYPADVQGVSALADAYGVPVVEDAAQAAGGQLSGQPLGSFGDLAVLSFGRGKGIAAGCGGALLANAPGWEGRFAGLARGLAPAGNGWSSLVAASAHWALGRPWLYGVPASIPWLHLGEMVYHPAHEPAGMPRTAAAILPTALRAEAAERRTRRENAAVLREMAALRQERHGDVAVVREVEGGDSGELRLPLLEFGDRAPARRLGILPGYPRTLHEQPELLSCLMPGEPETPGSAELRRTLVTLPVHSQVTAADRARIERWLASGLGRASRALPLQAPRQTLPSRALLASPTRCGTDAQARVGPPRQ